VSIGAMIGGGTGFGAARSAVDPLSICAHRSHE
jgi:hypothetical protein